MAKLLVIDDDPSVLMVIQRGLSQFEVTTADTGASGVEAIRRTQPDVVLLDIMLRETTGMELFQKILELDPTLPVIFITSEAGSESAITAMQLRAFDYISKPLDLPILTELVQKAIRTRQMMNVPVALGTDPTNDINRDAFIGRSPRMLDVFKAIGRVAQQNVTVLIRGESGTGKELVARAIYQHSDRLDRPFMAVNCAALPDNLLESELFGHEKGSFTGAEKRRIGKFEQCHGGTILLDEVGDMSPTVQAKVLRLLQDQQFERVGGNETLKTDVRILSATNRPLEEMVKNGEFREDLLYRLNGVTIHLPPLRERKQDLMVLIQHYLTWATRELNKPEIQGVAPDALQRLLDYDWPGNVRELQAVIRQAVLNSSGRVIVADFLPPEVIEGANRSNSGETSAAPVPQAFSAVHEPTAETSNVVAAPEEVRGTTRSTTADLAEFVQSRLTAGTHDLYAETLAVMERFLIIRVLQVTGGNQSKAAEILGITRGKIRDRIATFGISIDKSVSLEND